MSIDAASFYGKRCGSYFARVEAEKRRRLRDVNALAELVGDPMSYRKSKRDTYRCFSKQQEAFDFIDLRCTHKTKSQNEVNSEEQQVPNHVCLRTGQKLGMFAEETNAMRKRKYVVAPYVDFASIAAAKDVASLHFYELIREGSGCWLYFDLEHPIDPSVLQPVANHSPLQGEVRRSKPVSGYNTEDSGLPITTADKGHYCKTSTATTTASTTATASTDAATTTASTNTATASTNTATASTNTASATATASTDDATTATTATTTASTSSRGCDAQYLISECSAENKRVTGNAGGGGSVLRVFKRELMEFCAKRYGLQLTLDEIIDLDSSAVSKFSHHIVVKTVNHPLRVAGIKDSHDSTTAGLLEDTSEHDDSIFDGDQETAFLEYISSKDRTCSTWFPSNTLMGGVVQEFVKDLTIKAGLLVEGSSEYVADGHCEVQGPERDAIESDETVFGARADLLCDIDDLLSSQDSAAVSHQDRKAAVSHREPAVEGQQQTNGLDKNSIEILELLFPIVHTREGQPQRICIVDTTVYSRNRLMRLLYSSKYGEDRALQARDEDNPVWYRSLSGPAERLLASLITLDSYWDKAQSEVLGLPVFRHNPPFFCHATAGATTTKVTLNKGPKPAAAVVRLNTESVKFNCLQQLAKSGDACKFPAHGMQILRFMVRKWNKWLHSKEEQRLQKTLHMGENNISSVVWFPETEVMIVTPRHNRFCQRIGREHKSNAIMLVGELKKASFHQKCHDFDCRNFKSSDFRLPSRLFLCEDEIMALQNI